jgi:hypothetical protein
MTKRLLSLRLAKAAGLALALAVGAALGVPADAPASSGFASTAAPAAVSETVVCACGAGMETIEALFH